MREETKERLRVINWEKDPERLSKIDKRWLKNLREIVNEKCFYCDTRFDVEHRAELDCMDGHCWWAWNLHPWSRKEYKIVLGIKGYITILCNDCFEDLKINPLHPAWSEDWSWQASLIVGRDKFGGYDKREIQPNFICEISHRRITELQCKYNRGLRKTDCMSCDKFITKEERV